MRITQRLRAARSRWSFPVPFPDPHLMRGFAAMHTPDVVAPTLHAAADHHLHACLDDGDDPAVVFESGMAGGCTSWTLVLRHLRTSHAIVTYDRFGIGASPCITPDLSVEAMGRRLAALLDTLLPGRPIVLVGYSLGGLIVRGAAPALGERLRGMVLVDPCAEGTDTDQPDERLAYPLLSLRAEIHSRLRRHHEHRHESAAWLDAVRRWVDHPPPAPTCPVTVLRATRNVPLPLRALSPRFQAVHEHRLQAVATMADALPQAKLVDVDCTHLIHLQAPKAVATAIQGLLADVSSRVST